MAKLYIFFYFLLMSTIAAAQTDGCRPDIYIEAEKGKCGILMKKIESKYEDAYPNSIAFELTGSTVQSGVGTGEGIFFNIGQTTVTYYSITTVRRLKLCSFRVNVLGDSTLRRQHEVLPELTICPGETITPPRLYKTCSEEEFIEGVVLDSSELGKQKYVTWVYRQGGRLVDRQLQAINVIDPRYEFGSPRLSTVIGECFINRIDTPYMVNNCTGEKVYARPKVPIRLDKPDTTTITWVYKINDTFYVQEQHLQIAESKQIRPVVKLLDTIFDKCGVSLESPLAYAGCNGQMIEAKTKDNRLLQDMGTYRVNWVFSYAGQTLEQQQIVVIGGERLSLTRKSIDTILPGCTAVITSFPTATRCNGDIITGVPMNRLHLSGVGPHVIRWRFSYKTDTLYQQQVVRLSGSRKITPAIAQLPTLVAGCSLTVHTKPIAFYGCDSVKIEGHTKQPLSYKAAGVYTITWTYTHDDTSVTQQQIVEVKAAGELVPALAVLPEITGSCLVKLPDGPTATNNCTGKIIRAYTRNPATYTKPGTYTVEWIFEDEGAKPMVQTQVVKVIPSTVLKPLVAALPLLSGDCSVQVTDRPRATDPCTGAILTAQTSDPLHYQQPGAFTIRWYYIVNGQEVLEQLQEIRVTDLSKLIPDKPSLPVIEGNCSAEVLVKPTAHDPCSGTLVTAATTDPLTYSVAGEYTVHWVYQSGGKRLTQHQRVIVKSSERLIAEQIQLPDLTGDCMVSVQRIPVAFNSCSGLLAKAKTNDPLVYTTPGTYTINWIFKDGGVESSQTQRVIVYGKPEKLMIFPNPTRTDFRIMSVGCNLPEQIDMKIFDITGKILERRWIKPNTEVVFGAGYQGGVYILHLVQGTTISVTKLVKAK